MALNKKTRKHGRTTLLLGLIAGFSLVAGVIYVFDLPIATVGGTLGRLIVGLLIMMALAFLAAGCITLIKKLLARRR